nr:potassium channel family protein [Deinococcota bacterium]
MSILILLAGIFLVALVAFDMIVTTLVLSSGGGPLTGKVSDWLWKLALKRHARAPSHRALSRVVWVMLLLVLALWALLLLTGWSLIFTAYGSAVVNSTTGEAAGFWSRVYFAGYAFITLGVGDYRPQGPLWQLATVMAAINGFSAVTLTLAYLIPIVSAGVEKRQLAASISGLGRSPQDMLLRAWNGTDFSLLTPYMVSFASNINLHAQRHLAYPVLHYFHSEQASLE